jgi:hypothetical protein
MRQEMQERNTQHQPADEAHHELHPPVRQLD